jgi:hypothetical protein
MLPIIGLGMGICIVGGWCNQLMGVGMGSMKQVLNLVVTYAQLDSNIRVLYIFFVIFKKYGPKYAKWYKKEEENRASSWN